MATAAEIRPTQVGDARSHLVAGLLREALGSDASVAAVAADTAGEMITALIGESSLWSPVVFQQPRELDDYADASRRMLAHWEPPAGGARLAPAVADAGWSALQPLLSRPTFSADEQAAFRLEVRDIPSALQLKSLGAVEGIVVAPVIAAPLGDGRWRWPLRVAVAPSPSAGQQLAQLQASGFEMLRDVVLLGDADDQRVDILITSADAPLVLARLDAVGVVIVVGDRDAAGDAARLGDLVNRGVEFRPGAVIAAPTGTVEWFHEFVKALSHDWPVDVAAAKTIPGCVVVGDPEFLAVTSLRVWLKRVGERLIRQGDGPAAAELLELAGSRVFRREMDGGTDSSVSVRNIEGVRGEPVELVVSQPRAAMRPDDDDGRGAGSEGEPVPVPPPVRKLQTLVRDANGAVRNDAFLRGTLMALKVRIAAHQLAGAVTAPVGFVSPVTGKAVDLDVLVQVAGAPGRPMRRTLRLPATADSAWTRAITLDVPDRRGSLDVFVVVQYQGRTVQSARLRGPLRVAAAKLGEPAMELSVDVSNGVAATAAGPGAGAPPGAVAPPAPATAMRGAATASLVEMPPLKGKPQLFDAGGKLLFDPAQISTANTAVQKALVTALSTPAADLAGAGPALTRLAIHGALLRNALKGKAATFYDDAEWVHITTFGPSHVPYELIYTHPMPNNRDGVPVCQPALDHADRCEASCADRSRADRVCPFGFWATSKVVERRPHVDGRTNVLADQVSVAVRTNAMVAVTKKADAKDPTTSARIRAAVGGFCKAVSVATGWADVHAAAEAGPSLLVWVTHTIRPELDDDMLGADLELSGSTLPVINVAAEYVNPQGRTPGPVVLALGCSTEHLPASYSSYETQLFGAHAEVVVTALCEIPGSVVAGFVERLVEALAAVLANDGHHRFGQALTAARRATIRQGDLFALALTSAGDGDVQLTGG
ncbi:MAG: hypothetical protein Q7V88_03190 [Actinomycetota bacterium]|nr:hypothetical protein [Actinomycetota bacterium]